MEINDFKIYPTSEDNSFDANGAFKGTTTSEPINTNLEQPLIPSEDIKAALDEDADIFSDENIENTLREYNYDYKLLLRELTSFIDYSVLMEILSELGIKKEEYLAPTYVTFEKIRAAVINGKTKSN